MLYLIGLGLGDAKDISVKGLEVVKKANKVFLEAYTSILRGGKEELVGDFIEIQKQSCKKLHIPVSFIVHLLFDLFIDVVLLIFYRKNFMGGRSYLLTERWWSKKQVQYLYFDEYNTNLTNTLLKNLFTLFLNIHFQNTNN